MSINRLVDQLEAQLGDSATPELVERLATILINDRPGTADHSTELPDAGNPDLRWTSPVSVGIGVSLLGCGSRLSATVSAHAYDVIRRSTSTLPTRLRRLFSESGMHVPDIRLVVSDAADLLYPFDTTEALRISSMISAASEDCGFDSVDLLSLDLAASPVHAELLPLIPDILNNCSGAYVNINLGSTHEGVRSDDVYAAALILLSMSTQSARRISLSVNGEDSRKSSGTELSLVLSVWPLLEAVRSDAGPETCYSDRLAVLGYTGRLIRSLGDRILDQMLTACSSEDRSTVRGRCSVCIDEPGHGPVSAGIWAGFPLDSQSFGAAGRLSGLFLRHGLLRDSATASDESVLSDGLPLTDSIRNILGVPEFTRPAMLAAFLASAFMYPVQSSTGKWIRILPVEQNPDGMGVYLPDIPGIVPVLDDMEPWMDGHFTCRGMIIPAMLH
jgi:Uncharacterised ACR (DUF711)